MLYDDQPLDLNPALVDGRRGPLSLPLSLAGGEISYCSRPVRA